MTSTFEPLERRRLFTTYSFTKIAQSSDFANFDTFDLPSINHLGVVVFEVRNTAGAEAIRVGTGGATQLIVNNAGALNHFLGQDINDGGVVAFSASLDAVGAMGVFKSNGITTTPIASTATFDSIGPDPAINENGLVAFPVAKKTTLDQALFVGSGGALTEIDSGTNGLNDGYTAPTMTNGGEVVFFHEQEEEMQLGDGSAPATTILTFGAGGDVDTFGSAPTINNNGLIAFEGRLNQAGEPISIYTTTDGSSFDTFVDVAGPYDVFDTHAINDSGVIAFSVSLDSGPRGIFTGADPIADKVIEEGDALFGSTVTSVFFYHHGLNNGGQIAFRASLADGRDVIVRADPVHQVELDVRTSNPTDPINLKAHGPLHVAVLSSATFDATQIDTTDLSAIKLGDPALSGRSSAIAFKLKDVNNDGRLDLLLTFSIDDIAAKGALSGASTQAQVGGPVLGAGLFVAVDSIKVVP